MKTGGKKLSETRKKTKTIFNHLNEIYQNQTIDYFSSLDDAEKKTYSIYMINRLVSMNPDYIVAVNEIQQYNNITAEAHYLFLSQLLPRKRQWNKYIKANKGEDFPEALVELVAKHHQTSHADARVYLKLFFLGGIENLLELLRGYGLSDKDIKKLGIK